MDLDMNYSYDFNEDWVPASKNQLRTFWVFGIVNCFSGSVFLINYLQDDPPKEKKEEFEQLIRSQVPHH